MNLQYIAHTLNEIGPPDPWHTDSSPHITDLLTDSLAILWKSL